MRLKKTGKSSAVGEADSVICRNLQKSFQDPDVSLST
jgi:hypothetical protein